jgi:hypothetical protein
MGEGLKVLSVFLASPGDLADERQVAREVIDDLNESIRPSGLHVELLGWEDTRPGAGRPQSIINKDVDSCDLFVGMMWRHWGTPTGTHTSGFEEEFERASGRRPTHNSPEIWLCFKAIGAEYLKDPGPQLQRVVEFRQRQIERREVLFREFVTTEDWRNLFRKWMLSFVLELLRGDSGSGGAITSPPSPPSAANESQAPSATDSSLSSPQLQELADFIRRAEPDAAYLRWPKGNAHVVVAHLQIAASAVMAASYPDVKVGIHEANLAYSVRLNLELTLFERLQIVRSTIADQFERVPGWYWFTPSDPVSALFHFAADSDDAVAEKSFELLKKSRILPTTDFARRVVNEHLRTGASAVREAVIDYLAWTGEDAGINAADLGGVLPLYAEAMLSARLRRGEESAVDEADERPSLSSRLLSAVEEFAQSATPQGLLRAVASRHESLRLASAAALFRAGSISDSLAFTLVRDSNAKVRAIAQDVLIAGGAEVDLAELQTTSSEVSVDEKRSMLVAYYRRLSFETLLSRLNFFATDGVEIYEALGLEYAQRFLNRVRRDLQTDMSVFYEEWLAEMRQLYQQADEIIKDTWTEKPDLLAFVKSRFIAAALRIISIKGNKSDAEAARRYLPSGNVDVEPAAVAVLTRFGKAGDAVALVEVAERSYGSNVQLAAAGATKLSRSLQHVVMPLLKSGKVSSIRPAVESLRKGPKGRAIAVLKSLLHADKPWTRIMAVQALVDIDRDKAESLLDEYQQGYRFYDAVCWFDRLLFAPAALQAAYRRELDEAR